MNEPPSRHLTLHEAMILALLEHKRTHGPATLSNATLEAEIAGRDLYRQRNGDHPDAAQIFLRARQCSEWFDLSGDARSCTISLKPMKCGGA